MGEAVAGWDTFYVIIGSSAAALTGLMFVVITLTAETRMGSGATTRGLEAFGSPTVVHFCFVLLIAAVLTSPMHTAVSLGLCVAVVGLIGLGYTVAVILRMQRVESYDPVGEDWLFHVCFPVLAYLTFMFSAAVLWRGSATALYYVAAASLLLLYTGIHNAWDTATWMAIHGKDGPTPPEKSDGQDKA
jgi:hypothetical protein